ncbi:MAG: hypothetical protein IPK52_25755 [Chloroflexi bacterium]|nr:hypothetical protein [Chloroflexota bacterium]
MARTIIKSLIIVGYLLAITAAVTAVGGDQEGRAASPANDNFASAMPVVFNTTQTVKNTHMATTEAGEPLEHCVQTHTKNVWFTFVAPFSGKLAFSTAGSRFSDIDGSFVTSASITVYSGTALNALSPVDCANIFPVVLTDVDIVAGTAYYIVVSVAGTTAPSVLKFKSSIVTIHSGLYNLGLMNPGFESPLGVGWKLQNATNGDYRECFVDPYQGACYIKLIGGPNEATVLKQTVPWPSSVLLPRVGDLIMFYGVVKSAAPVNLTVALKIIYADGTPTTVVKTKRTLASGYAVLAVQELIASRSVASLKLSFTNRATGGSVLVDGTDILFFTGLLRAAPLAAPHTLRQ